MTNKTFDTRSLNGPKVISSYHLKELKKEKNERVEKIENQEKAKYWLTDNCRGVTGKI